MDLTPEEEGGGRLVGAALPAIGAGTGAVSGMDTVFFSWVVAA